VPSVEPVIIMGGGPVGLCAALELARFHVPAIVLEQRKTTSWHPKTRNLNTRTMEIARGWGTIVDRRLRGTDIPGDWKSPIRFLESVVGQEFGTIDSQGFTGPGPDVSPSRPVMSSQDLTEKIFYDAAVASGLVDLRFGHRVDKVLGGWRDDESDAAVDVTDLGTGKTYALRGSALVAADGVDSLVRRQLGVRLDGEPAIAHFINCYFRADIERHVGERRGVLLFVVNQGAAGVLQPLDAHGRWLCQISVSPQEWDSETFTAERCHAWIRAAVGVDDLEAEVLSIGRWRMNATVAERLAHGRIVLCGDAAHQFPPTGGLGANTGLQGMHNVMWKLALYVRGRAGRRLLETYDTERRPVAVWAAEQSLRNYHNVGKIGAAIVLKIDNELSATDVVAASRRYGNHLGLEFGAAYHSAAVVSDGTTPPEVEDPYSDYTPSATPGCRAPHTWLGRASGRLSTLDLFGPGFTVLTGSGGDAWRRSATAASRRHKVPIASYAIDDTGLEDHDGIFFDRYGIKPDGAVLIRPDGHVGWRSAGTADAERLDEAVATILGR
jgi:putative polyketide hydroxylase